MSQFVVDLLDGSNIPLGDGPLQNILNVSVTEELDKAGQVTFSVPATDTRAATLIDTAARFRVRFSSGKLVYAIIISDTIDATSKVRTVVGADMLQELAHYSMGWWALYDDQDINTVILPDLVADTPWSLGTIDASLGDLYYIFDGDSRLAALVKIAQAIGKHFRLGATFREFDFGSFGDATTTRITNVDHATAGQDSTSDISIIGSLQITSDRGPVVNRIIPWGSGSDGGDLYRAKVSLFHLNPAASEWANIKAKPGVRGTQTTITSAGSTNHYVVTSTTGFYTDPINQAMWCYDPDDLTLGIGYDMVMYIVTPPNDLFTRGSATLPPIPTSFPAYFISSPQLYIQDDTAYAADPHEAVIVFNDVMLANLSGTAFASAAMQLYKRAWNYLQAYKTPQMTYSIAVLNCPESLRVGDTVPLQYRGVVTRDGVTTKWIDVDEVLNVISITRNYNADGSTSASLNVSNVARQPTDFVSAMSATNVTTSAMSVTVGAPSQPVGTVSGVAVDLTEIHTALVTLGLITT